MLFLRCDLVSIDRCKFPLSLRDLLLNGNNIHNLSVNSFNGLEYLESLHLNHCNIIRIFPSSFSALKNLKNLFLENNKILTLSPGMFNGLDSCETICLNYCKIVIIEKFSFLNLNNLKTLHLKGNNISLWQHDYCLDNLINLDVSECNFTDIKQILHLKKLEALNIKNNSIAQIDAEDIISFKSLKFLGINDEQKLNHIGREISHLDFDKLFELFNGSTIITTSDVFFFSLKLSKLFS